MTATTDPAETAAAPEQLEERHVVTAFLVSEGKILLLRRSSRVHTYTGRWAGVSGSVDPGRSPEEQSRVEIGEETGLEPEDVQLVKSGEALTVVDRSIGRRWIVHPFRYAVTSPERIRIDWEHVELRWVDPAELLAGGFETVPGLAETWLRVA